MDLSFVVLVLGMFFIPPLAMSWDARRRGHRGLVWLLAGVAGPVVSILGAFAQPSRDPVAAIVLNLLANPLSYAMFVVLISYLLSRPWRSPVVR